MKVRMTPVIKGRNLEAMLRNRCCIIDVAIVTSDVEGKAARGIFHRAMFAHFEAKTRASHAGNKQANITGQIHIHSEITIPNAST